MRSVTSQINEYDDDAVQETHQEMR